MKSKKKEKDITDDLNEEEIKNLDKAIAGADRGEAFTPDEFKKLIEDWKTWEGNTPEQTP